MTDPLTDRVIGPTTERSLWLLFGSVGFVLLIACANVANLVLARAAARRTEFSVRTALGASRMRLVRQTLTENVVLVDAGRRGRAVLAWGGTVALRHFAAGALPRTDTIQLDVERAALPAGRLARQRPRSPGLLPALQLSMTRPAEVLREDGPRALGGRGGRRLHQGLVVAEIALAVILLSGAGLLTRSFLRVQAANRGFDSTQRAPAAGRSARDVRQRREDDGVLHRGDPPAPRAARCGRRRRDQRLLHPPAAGLPGGGRRPASAAARRSRAAADGGSGRARILRGHAHPAAPRPIAAGERPRARGAARRRHQRRDGAALLAGPGSRRQTTEVRARSRRQEPMEDGRRRRGRHAAAAAGRAGDSLHVPAGHQLGRWTSPSGRSTTRSCSREAIRAEMRALDPTVPPYGIVTVEQRLGRTVALRRLQTLLLVALPASR